MSENIPCPCGTGNYYVDCCKKAHDNIFSVQSAETLMRSRYSAFVLAKGNYLKLSQHSSTQPKNKREVEELELWSKSVMWLKLEVLNSANGQAQDAMGTVEFKAFYMEQAKACCIHEKSSFIKENGHWVYLDGVSF